MKNTLLLTSLLICLLLTSASTVHGQWAQTSETFTSPGAQYTRTQLAEHFWGGTHALLFNAYKQITVNGTLAETGNSRYAKAPGAYGGGAGAIMFIGNGGTMDFYISPQSTGAGSGVNWGDPKMRILRNGEVGIGTTNYTSTGYLFSVAGKIRVEEIKVQTGWADFVFKDDYDLRSLEEVEDHISENGHLPEIPSEAEVLENGIHLGEMNAKLLQKIEELTLYLIEQNKEIKDLKKEVSALKKK